MSPTTQNILAKVIPIGRRIGEIMEEKGAAFSQRSFGPRVGLSKDTLGRIIDGERHVRPSELQRVAEGLSLSLSRLKQEDTISIQNELEDLLISKRDLNRALLLAEKLLGIGIGVTERCDCAVFYARTVYALGQYDVAHEYLLQAYRDAEKIYEKYQETDRLYDVLSKLLITFVIRKEFSHLSEILSRIDPIFESNPERMGSICFSKAMIAEQFGHYEEVRKNLYRSLELYQMTGRKNDIGRAEQNVGHFEFKQKNYEVAKSYLFDSITNLQDDTFNQLIAIKSYAKTLLKLEDFETATVWLEKALHALEQYPELKGKFYLLLALAKKDVSYADAIFLIPNAGKKVLRLTCKYLTQHYLKLGDSNAVMKYSMIAERYTLNHSDIIDEEDL